MLRCYGRNGYEVITNQEILEKAIQKAIDGGWDNIGNKRIDERLVIRFGTYNFDIAFFKALWGEYPTYTHDGFKRYYEGQNVTSWLGGEAKEAIKDDKFATGSLLYVNWQYHLHFMVIAEDPIKYLGDHI
jgi:hypothetical protein